MKQYSEEFKATIIAKMLPPRNVSVPELARETGIPRDTLYTWRIKNRKRQAATSSKNTDNDGLSSEDKFNIVIETATMNETELSAYCRRKGLYPEQITGWKQLCLKANTPLPTKANQAKIRRQAKENKQLKAELRRKEKALAETAALLVLKKKARQIWGDPEDE
jgi:transposase-like protein